MKKNDQIRAKRKAARWLGRHQKAVHTKVKRAGARYVDAGGFQSRAASLAVRDTAVAFEAMVEAIATPQERARDAAEAAAAPATPDQVPAFQFVAPTLAQDEDA